MPLKVNVLLLKAVIAQEGLERVTNDLKGSTRNDLE
jgi:hypothetical protein